MSARSRRSILACVLLALLAVSAGCLGDGGDGELPDRDAVADSLGSIEAVEGQMHMEQRVGNETTVLDVEFVQRTTTGELRAAYRQQSPSVRYEVVSNGSTMGVYNESENTVQSVELAGVRTEWNRSVQSVADIFASLAESSSDDDVSISPLPAVPGGDGAASSAVGAGSLPNVGNLSMTYRGTATAGGQEAYVVDFEPTTNRSLINNGTIWFDTDRYYPIKTSYSASIEGRSSRITTEYRNLTYNPSVDEGAFTFEPPANATVAEDSQSLSVYQSREELVDGTDQSVPDPDLPEGYEFAEGAITADGENRSLTLQYANDGNSLSITKRTPPREDSNATDASDEAAETVDVAGHEGTYRELGEASALSWQCEGSEYTLAGQLSKSELESIAETMACE